jgi:DNA-binding protein HU-beta
MNKAELISAIAEQASLTKVDTRRFLDAFLDVTSTTLINGEKVTLFGFGTFSIANRKARVGHNPKTKARIDVPARKVVKFKAGIDLSANVK